jgi:hypothetical protein
MLRLSLEGLAPEIMEQRRDEVMLAVCMLGCVVPTRRALNVEPTIA